MRCKGVGENVEKQLQDVVNLFGDIDVAVESNASKITFVVNGEASSIDMPYDYYGGLVERRKYLIACKNALYEALSRVLRRDLPWGSLTGIRPVKLARMALNESDGTVNAAEVLEKFFHVSPKRAHIIDKILAAQEGKTELAPNCVNLYIHIPFCKTKCKYCSFITEVAKEGSDRERSYIDALCKEIVLTYKTLNALGLTVATVYIGGGTPTAISAESLKKLLATVAFSGGEYTVEAGRPDTITSEKVQIMHDNNVTRVCVNPQTLNDKTLQAIGRNHTVKEFYDAYALLSEKEFIVNVDLIAGFFGESFADFMHSFDGVCALRPQNFTVHTLSRKNGSAYYQNAPDENEHTEDMMNYAIDAAEKNGYNPYYLYRQKRMASNLENIGFAIKGTECINNITVMEETASVIACGAGSISKCIRDNVISRFANARDVKLYCDEFDERITKKLKFYENQFTRVK